jgi:hypothetical protein
MTYFIKENVKTTRVECSSVDYSNPHTHTHIYIHPTYFIHSLTLGKMERQHVLNVVV